MDFLKAVHGHRSSSTSAGFRGAERSVIPHWNSVGAQWQQLPVIQWHHSATLATMEMSKRLLELKWDVRSENLRYVEVQVYLCSTVENGAQRPQRFSGWCPHSSVSWPTKLQTHFSKMASVNTWRNIVIDGWAGTRCCSCRRVSSETTSAVSSHRCWIWWQNGRALWLWTMCTGDVLQEVWGASSSMCLGPSTHLICSRLSDLWTLYLQMM